MARRKRVRRYINPKAPKDQGTGPRKKFRVAEHAAIHVEDEDGVVRKYSGKQASLDCMEGEEPLPVYAYLTEEMATFYGKLGYIEVELDFGVEKDAEIGQLKDRAASDASTIEALQRRIAELEAAGRIPSQEQADDAAISALISSGATAKAEPDTAEDGAGDDADSGGGEPSSGPSSGSEPKAAKPPRRTRRKAL